MMFTHSDPPADALLPDAPSAGVARRRTRERYDARASVYLTRAEMALVARVARASGLSISAWVSELALSAAQRAEAQRA